MPFYNLLTGAFGLIVIGIWQFSDAWKQNTRRWWLDTKCHSEEGGAYIRFWELYWVMTEAD